MVLTRQTAYSQDPAKLFAGMLAYGTDFRDIQTRVNAVVGLPKIVTTTLAATWAVGDDLTTTIAGRAVQTTADTGEDTVEEVRDAHVVDLLADAEIGKLVMVVASGTDKIVFTGLDQYPPEGVYLDYAHAVAVTTAGNGTYTAAVTQAFVKAGIVRFGTGVAFDPNDDRGKKVVYPSATGFKFAGIVVHSHAIDGRKLPDGQGVPVTNPFNVIMKGYVACPVEEAVQPGDPLYMRHTAKGALLPGGFRKSADSASADQIPGHWETGASAGEIAIAAVNAA